MNTRKKRRYNVYLLTSLAIIAVSLTGGWLLEKVISNPTGTPPITTKPAEKLTPQEELYVLFRQGIMQMQQKKYPLAQQTWLEFLALSPQSADAHVNLGFTRFELGLFHNASQSFLQALELNSYQNNAYYGLGISLEAQGDLEGALGAMRSYIHLAEPEDSFMRKAASAVWEWESEIEKRRRETASRQDTIKSSEDP